jgi:hypothetical protein
LGPHRLGIEALERDIPDLNRLIIVTLNSSRNSHRVQAGGELSKYGMPAHLEGWAGIATY